MFVKINKSGFKRLCRKAASMACLMIGVGVLSCFMTSVLVDSLIDTGNSTETSGANARGLSMFFSKERNSGENEAIEEQKKSGALETAADGNWGLSFQIEGQPPVGNATAEDLAKYNAYYIGVSSEASTQTTEKPIYLTFDAGYENGNTASILDTLKKHNVPACFFLVGNYLETSPDLVKRMVAEGHTVGNHTMHHSDMSAIGTEEAFKEELTSLEAKYKEITGEDMVKVYRPPQGKYSESNLKMANDLGYKTVFWSLAHVDWYENDQPTHEEAMKKLTSRIHPGAIVLLHSTSKTNAEILDELLTAWESEGYTFRSITEL